jgi:hypothetical protein
MVIAKYKKHATFTKEELKDLLVSILTISVIFFLFFIVTFWKKEEISSILIMQKALLLLISVSLILFGLIMLIKHLSLLKGYTAEYSSWKTGLLSGGVLSFLSFGYIPVSFFGTMNFTIIDRLRYGKVHVGENKREIKSILLMTYLFSFTILIFMYMTSVVIDSSNLFYFSLMFSYILFCSLLPFKKSLGVLFFFSQQRKTDGLKVYFPFIIFSFLITLAIGFNSFILVLLSIVITPIIWVVIKKVIKR